MSAGHACRLCGADLTRSFVDLGMSPLCESYLAADAIDAPEIFYPLHVLLCDECLLVQLPAYVSGEHIVILHFLGRAREAVCRRDDRKARADRR